MNRMIAFCGIICSDCPAYLATQADDRDALEQVLAHWREDFDVPHIPRPFTPQIRPLAAKSLPYRRLRAIMATLYLQTIVQHCAATDRKVW